jgi:hypothetical protein
MRKSVPAVLATLALFVMGITVSTKAQTITRSATFTFGSPAPCSNITSWNGVANAYPDMGGICPYQGDTYGGYGSFLDVPFQLGFLNNGYLAGCNPLTWGQKTFTNGDGTHAGDTFTQPAVTNCPYYTGEYGDPSLSVGWSIVGSFAVVSHTYCGRYGCHTFLSTVLKSGTGVVVETQN